MKKTVLKVLVILLAIPLSAILGAVLWMLGIRAYVFLSDVLKPPDVLTRVETLTPEQTALVVDYFGLEGIDMGPVEQYCWVGSQRLGHEGLSFFTDIDPEQLEAHMTQYSSDLSFHDSGVIEVPRWTYLPDGSEAHYSRRFYYCPEQGTNTRMVYILADGSGCVFVVNSPPEELRFPGKEKSLP